MRVVAAESPAQTVLCAELARRIWEEFYTPIIGAEQVAYMLRTFQSAEAIAAQSSEGYRYYLLYDDDTPVGYCAAVAEADVLKVSKLYVLQRCRGGGGGRMMLTQCERTAAEAGLKRLRLTVNRHNLSVGFYERVGFVRTGTQVTPIGGGFVMDDYVMERPVPFHGSE